jgi:transposase InsO family protein
VSIVKELSGRGPLGVLLAAADLPRSTYYYCGKEGKRGRRPVGYTKKRSGGRVSDAYVVSKISKLLGRPFVSYGYVKVTHHLRQRGYVINKKKVYRLMKEEKLLLPKRVRTRGPREFVKFRVVRPQRPYEYLEMDIKYFWLCEEKRNAYLLSVLDVFSREVVGWKVKRSIRKGDVVRLLKEIFASIPDMRGVRIRTDNGSQFLAHRVRDYLKEMEVHQEFTHVGTPEENCHIEALHSVLEREVESRFEFATLEDLERVLVGYFLFYNRERGF